MNVSPAPAPRLTVPAGPAGGRLSRAVRTHPIRWLLGSAFLSLAVAGAVVVAVGSAGSGWGNRSAAGAQQAAAIGHRQSIAGGADLGRIWGAAFRGQAPSYEPLSTAEVQAGAIPASATVDRQTNTVRFAGPTAALTVVASPPNGRDMAFRAAGLENPTIEVRQGARVTVRFVNGDSDSAHGWLLLDPIVESGRTFHGPRAFPGAYAPILGDPTNQGQPDETIRFTATASGTYRYGCPVPGHAAMGMQGTFEVTA